MRRRFFLFGAFLGLLSACRPSVKKKRIFLLGDSTVASYPTTDRMAGWGQYLGLLLINRAEVINSAVPGSSSRSYYMNYWPKLRSRIESGDVVLIQFGHVDALDDPERRSDPDSNYRAHLKLYISEVIHAGAQPILVTPVARFRYTNGVPTDVLSRYAEVMRHISSECGVFLIDLAVATLEGMKFEGEVVARSWFMISIDQKDEVHLTDSGAAMAAEIVARALVNSGVLGGC